MSNQRNGRNGRNGNGLTTTIRYRNESGEAVEQEVANYKGLLGLAHEDGLKRITTTLVQIPTEANGMTAIATAEVETVRGVFQGIGDACPANVNRRIAPHVMRMAETRAKARALRDAVNIGTVALEELGDLNADDGDGGDDPLSPAPLAIFGATNRLTNAEATRGKSNGNGGDFMTEPQRRLLFRLMATRGVTGTMAQERLCSVLAAADLKSVPRSKASELIDRLKAEDETNGRKEAA